MKKEELQEIAQAAVKKGDANLEIGKLHRIGL